MVTFVRFPKNPILAPLSEHPWEAEATFNGCPILAEDGCHMLYRAQSSIQQLHGSQLEVSTIGHAISFDRVTFLNRRQWIVPTESWEKYGCEDPRVTFFEGKYYIFYTAIASWPPIPSGIAVALVKTQDFFKVDSKHLITPFNAKAMTLFPKRINGKIAVMLTVNCDIPPSTIAIAYVDDITELTQPIFWNTWVKDLDTHAIHLLRTTHDHVEIGAPPIWTPKGWLLLYSYIKSYLTSHKFFTVEAVLLDLDNPQKILSRTQRPLLYPEFDYEREGKIPNIVFPSGALVHNDMIGLYYGAADTSVCLATIPMNELLDIMTRANDTT